MTGGMLKGDLEMLILAIVASRPTHGYAIIDTLRQRSGGAFDYLKGRSIRYDIAGSSAGGSKAAGSPTTGAAACTS